MSDSVDLSGPNKKSTNKQKTGRMDLCHMVCCCLRMEAVNYFMLRLPSNLAFTCVMLILIPEERLPRLQLDCTSVNNVVIHLQLMISNQRKRNDVNNYLWPCVWISVPAKKLCFTFFAVYRRKKPRNKQFHLFELLLPVRGDKVPPRAVGAVLLAAN